MKLATLFTINAVVSVLFGLGFLLVPATILATYGVSTNPPGLLLTQVLGGETLAYGVLSWLVRNMAEQTLRPVVLAFVVGFAVNTVILLLGQLSGAFNSLGWLNVVIFLLFAVGYAYFYSMKPSSS